MNLLITISLIVGGLSFLVLVFLGSYKIIERKIRRQEQDKPLVENHKFSLKPPTWRFQKYHPNKCPHHSGIYRKTNVNGNKKTIFVCADCIDIIEIEEIEQRDKFKKEIIK